MALFGSGKELHLFSGRKKNIEKVFGNKFSKFLKDVILFFMLLKIQADEQLKMNMFFLNFQKWKNFKWKFIFVDKQALWHCFSNLKFRSWKFLFLPISFSTHPNTFMSYSFIFWQLASYTVWYSFQQTDKPWVSYNSLAMIDDSQSSNSFCSFYVWYLERPSMLSILENDQHNTFWKPFWSILICVLLFVSEIIEEHVYLNNLCFF